MALSRLDVGWLLEMEGEEIEERMLKELEEGMRMSRYNQVEYLLT